MEFLLFLRSPLCRSDNAAQQVLLCSNFATASSLSALWALLLVLTPVYADVINCNESTAFIIWSLYSTVALPMVFNVNVVDT